jgi:hypothetical protein
MLPDTGERIDRELVIPLSNHCEILTLLLCQRWIKMAFGRFSATVRAYVTVVAVILTWKAHKKENENKIRPKAKLPCDSHLPEHFGGPSNKYESLYRTAHSKAFCYLSPSDICSMFYNSSIATYKLALAYTFE